MNLSMKRNRFLGIENILVVCQSGKDQEGEIWSWDQRRETISYAR